MTPWQCQSRLQEVRNAIFCIPLLTHLYSRTALPSRPFSSITLTDATSENALQYVQKKLKEYGKEELLKDGNQKAIERLGGRLTDLETLIQKMRGGASIDEAVDGEQYLAYVSTIERDADRIRMSATDIISRSSTEIMKNCFVEDNEEAKSLPWSREQAWYLIKALSKQKEVDDLSPVHVYMLDAAELRPCLLAVELR